MYFLKPSFILLMTIFCLQVSSQPLTSKIFSYAEPSNARGLHVSMRGISASGKEWQARDIYTADIPFFRDLFANPTAMEKFGDGQIRERNKTQLRCETSITRFADGQV